APATCRRGAANGTHRRPPSAGLRTASAFLIVSLPNVIKSSHLLPSSAGSLSENRCSGTMSLDDLGGFPMRVLQAYRFALDPTPRQERALASHVGARRFAFNWGLALVKERLEARARGEDVEVPWTLPALRREWNRQKHRVAPWWRENSKEAYSSGLDGLARALQNWSKSRQGERKGRRVGFPRFREKGRGRESVRFATGAIRVDDKSHVVLPRIGRVKTHEPTMALLRRIEAGTARILSATVAR